MAPQLPQYVGISPDATDCINFSCMVFLRLAPEPLRPMPAGDAALATNPVYVALDTYACVGCAHEISPGPGVRARAGAYGPSSVVFSVAFEGDCAVAAPGTGIVCGHAVLSEICDC